MTHLFRGSMPALVTPFSKGEVDEKRLRALVDWQIASGSHGLVPCGTTGEAPTVSYGEHERIISIVVEQAAGRVPVLAGCGSNATYNAIKLSKQAKKAGATGMLHVTPYYNKPSQEGLYRHYEAIAKAVDLPMVLYNVPSRTALNMEATTTLRLSKIDTIVGTKEAAGKLDQVDQIIKECGDRFAVYSGEDALNTQYYTLGGMGAVSVTANTAPDRVAKVWNEFAKGNQKEALLLQEKLQTLNEVLFIETNPVPVKTALSLMGKCEEEFRLPLCPMNEAHKIKLREVLQNEGLIE